MRNMLKWLFGRYKRDPYSVVKHKRYELYQIAYRTRFFGCVKMQTMYDSEENAQAVCDRMNEVMNDKHNTNR